MKLLLLAFAAGGIHVLAPDHWVPASILSWRRGWGRWTSVAFTINVMVLHVALGFALYKLLERVLDRVPAQQVFGFSVLLIAAVAVVRGFRFARVREVVRTEARWGGWAVISLLGPSESLLPLLVKAHYIRSDEFAPVLAYVGGTCLVAALLVTCSQRIWNRPRWLSQSMVLVRRRLASVPVAATIALGVTVLLR